MSERDVSVALHVGAHKTATTHLQLTLRQNRNLFLRAGVDVLLPGQLRRAGESLTDRLGVPDVAPVEGAGHAALLNALREGTDRLLVSEENLLGAFRGPRHRLLQPLYPRAVPKISAVVKAVAPTPVDLFLAIREPCGFLRGCYSQILLAGFAVSPATFFLDRGPEAVNWLGLVKRLRDIPGLRSLNVWAYEDYRDLGPALFDRMTGGRLSYEVSPAGTNPHASLSHAAVLAILEADPELPPRDVAAAAREAYPIGNGYPRFDPFPEDARDISKQAYAEQRAQIAALDGVTIISP